MKCEAEASAKTRRDEKERKLRKTTELSCATQIKKNATWKPELPKGREHPKNEGTATSNAQFTFHRVTV